MNRDQWVNVLEFYRTIVLDLSNYDPLSACAPARLGLRSEPRVLMPICLRQGQ